MKEKFILLLLKESPKQDKFSDGRTMASGPVKYILLPLKFQNLLKLLRLNSIKSMVAPIWGFFLGVMEGLNYNLKENGMVSLGMSVILKRFIYVMSKNHFMTHWWFIFHQKSMFCIPRKCSNHVGARGPLDKTYMSFRPGLGQFLAIRFLIDQTAYSLRVVFLKWISIPVS